MRRGNWGKKVEKESDRSERTYNKKSHELQRIKETDEAWSDREVPSETEEAHGGSDRI